MTKVGELEIRTQHRVVDHFQHQLGYAYLGGWQDRPNNRNIEADSLHAGTPEARRVPLEDRKP